MAVAIGSGHLISCDDREGFVMPVTRFGHGRQPINASIRHRSSGWDVRELSRQRSGAGSRAAPSVPVQRW